MRTGAELQRRRVAADMLGKHLTQTGVRNGEAAPIVVEVEPLGAGALLF